MREGKIETSESRKEENSRTSNPVGARGSRLIEGQFIPMTEVLCKDVGRPFFHAVDPNKVVYLEVI